MLLREVLSDTPQPSSVAAARSARALLIVIKKWSGGGLWQLRY